MRDYYFAWLLAVGAVCSCVPSIEPDTLTIVARPPEGYTASDTVHLVGTHNQWALEGEHGVEMEYLNGALVATIDVGDKDILFNFVKNRNWSHMASTKTGKSTCGYLYHIGSDVESLAVSIDGWMNEAPRTEVTSTLTGDIRTLENFDMPQLGRKGDIVVFLPPSYATSDDPIRYPVLYMLDGQNVFDEATSYSNEWRIDEQLSDMYANEEMSELIVVAVPNGPKRWQEYNPWDFLDNQNQRQKGRGNDTMAFIASTLKPYIDNQYRTRADAASTGLMGSSLGGMMAIYAAMEFDHVFGFVGAFSPSLAVKNIAGEAALIEGVSRLQTHPHSRIYIDMGEIEYDGYTEVEQLYFGLLEKGVPSDMIKLVKDDNGRHCELDWSERFPQAIGFLLN